MFHARDWRELRLDLVTYGLLRDKNDRLYRRLRRVVQEGYLIDNVKGSVALDVEWNAKDGNLDRDFGAYRAWHAARGAHGRCADHPGQGFPEVFG
ncbi:BglII/BstYI family type II restriction endonuclease [Pseudothauera hydrothermalis]|uniref:BglII/BstYI family type II restriction endonuclease n=1 Tax=Pseudothauera hydrothermalis TaxID=2184083 RepID=UPI0019672C2F|nr:BglII/BstYI family type II restriction endonuclease [Pseudothauera hydrothermalis]